MRSLCHPNALAGMSNLSHRMISSIPTAPGRRCPGGTLVTWKFRDGDEEMEISPQGRLTVSSAHNEIRAALAGRGIAHVIDGYARSEVEAGQRPASIRRRFKHCLLKS